ncbi:MAG: replication-relaxation family protein [Bacillota bacterium]
MKKNSAKIGHFLAILNVYKDIIQYGNLDTFLVEPKYGEKAMTEPDVFCIFRRTSFFIEVQKTIYSEKQMKDKLDRYKNLYKSGIITREAWQNPDKSIFPHILILSEQRNAIDRTYPFKVIQAQTFTKFLQMMKPREEKRVEPVKKSTDGGIKVRIQ